jgi:hypothetical protein
LLGAEHRAAEQLARGDAEHEMRVAEHELLVAAQRRVAELEKAEDALSHGMLHAALAARRRRLR